MPSTRKTHLKNSKRPPDSDFSQIAAKPPTEMVPIINTKPKVNMVTVNCKVSVQTTAFKPPSVV